MKRAMIMLLAAMLFCSMLPASAQEAWMEPYSETVTATFGRMTASPTFPEGEDITHSACTDWIEEQFNLKFQSEWLITDSNDYNTKITLAMASNSLVDIFEVRDLIQLRQLIDGGLVADLTDAIENNSSDLLKGIIESNGGMDAYFGPNVRGDDGKIYAFPCNAPGYEFSLVWVRQD